MTKFRITTVALAVVAAAALVAGLASAATTPPRAGAKCTKAGATAKVKTVSFVCTKTGTKLVWVVKKTATKPAAFSASFSGKAVVKVSGSKADIFADATGTGTMIGRSKLSGKGAGLSSEPCPLFGGPGVITAADGGTLTFVIATTGGSACTDESGQSFSLLGRATINGGTGKYAGAKGSFKFTGAFDRGSGAFSVKFIGTLTA